MVATLRQPKHVAVIRKKKYFVRLTDCIHFYNDIMPALYLSR